MVVGVGEEEIGEREEKKKKKKIVVGCTSKERCWNDCC
jgi:hypothetical protein